MKVTPTCFPDVLILTPQRFGDKRGFFSEVWNKQVFASHGLNLAFVQENHSISREIGTIRGLHFQAPPHAQAKLVRCGRGRFFDVAVDIRRGSPYYGQWVGVELSFDNGKQLLIPEGFLHGFITREPDTEIIYKCTEYYAPESEGMIRYDDPDIAIDWGQTTDRVTISEKDMTESFLRDFDTPFDYELDK